MADKDDSLASAHPAHAPSFTWRTDFKPATFATGALTAIFFYCGC
jgi:hypothetical protein